MSTIDLKALLFNTFAPIVATKISEFNARNVNSVKFIIKGGASIEHHVSTAGIPHDQFTYDIDIAPIFIPANYNYDSTYISTAHSFCNTLFDNISSAVPRGLIIYKHEHNGLITMQAKTRSSPDFVDVIDFSYVMPHDEGVMFTRAIYNYYASYEDFVRQYMLLDTIFSPVNIEICVVLYGLETYKGHLENVPKWEHIRDMHIQLKQQAEEEFVKMQKEHIELNELFGDDDDDDNYSERYNAYVERIKSYVIIVDGYTKQLHPTYIYKMKNKMDRYVIKGELLMKIGGDVSKCK
jgi:hypothetical protein